MCEQSLPRLNCPGIVHVLLESPETTISPSIFVKIPSRANTQSIPNNINVPETVMQSDNGHLIQGSVSSTLAQHTTIEEMVHVDNVYISSAGHDVISKCNILSKDKRDSILHREPSTSKFSTAVNCEGMLFVFF